MPAVPQAVRDAAAQRYDQHGEAAFRAALTLHDPISSARISPGDRQRLLRAWSMVEATGKPLPAWQAAHRSTLAPRHYDAVVLEPARADLYARCDARLDAMAEAGALDEVARLMARGLPTDLPAMKALGVREFAACLRGDTSLAEATAAAKQQTRNYAKRQSTWFRNQTPDWPRMTTLDAEAQWATMQALAGLSRA